MDNVWMTGNVWYKGVFLQGAMFNVICSKARKKFVKVKYICDINYILVNYLLLFLAYYF